MSLKQYIQQSGILLFIPIMSLSLLNPAIASAKDINNMMCAAMCHTPEIDKVDWKSRIELNTNLIVKNTLTDMRTLPLKTECIECSDDGIKSAV